MFKLSVNGACKQIVENAVMHETARRVYTAIRTITNGRLTQLGEVAAYVGVSSQVFKNWESRGVSKLGRLELHRKLDINPEWISTGTGEMLLPSTGSANTTPGPDVKGKGNYPVISSVAAGDWAELCDNFQPGDADEWGFSHHNLGPCGYMLRVSGKSMTNTESGARYSFPEGMLLHINPDQDPLPGKFVVVRREREKEATFKRLVSIDGELFLEAINPEWPNRYLKMMPGDVFCGVVVDASFGHLP